MTDVTMSVPDRTEAVPAEAGADGAPRPPRKFVLFADGTGNAFTRQESNVWRLYEALDRTRPDQVAYYIKGVGTASWAPLAALDGATGIGVPSNVRKLYRFLCWNWRLGDEIYIFGFSRGSFTARTLAAMISSQGLVPAEIGGVPVSHSDMQRNAMAAWREYRRDSIPWHKSLPTIWISRIVRDVVLGVYNFICRHPSYKTVRAAMDGRRDVEVEFLGVFDTVEAFGVPVEELRTAIDWAIWPISFRNGRLGKKVRRARHALALDDERTTFHPIRFEHKLNDPRIKEVWFTGVHSDVGGGYPDGTLAFVPLVWMASQVEGDLRFQPGAIDHFRTYQSAIGPMHDSRSGAAVFYRYGPRPIGESVTKEGGPPVVHFAVVERMLHGCDNYAPVTLPASAKVLLPDGRVMPLTEESTRREMRSAYWGKTKRSGAAAEQGAAAADAFMGMSRPDEVIVAETLDTVWWRRFWYFSLLVAAAFLVLWPLVAVPVVEKLKKPTDQVAADGVSALDVIRFIDYGVGAITGPPARMLEGILPSYVAPWLRIAVFYPFATSVVAAVVYLAWWMSAFLRDRIRERARLAWNRPDRKVADIGKPTWWLKVARFMRLHAWPLQWGFTKLVLPGAFLILLFGLALLVTGRRYFGWRDGTAGFAWRFGPPAFCNASKAPTLVGERAISVPVPFETKNPCWASGLWVEKGRKYRIWIDVRDPWFDRDIMTGVNGFDLGSLRLAAPIRRWIRGAWYQPVARIGENADAELLLQEIDGAKADDLPRLRDPTKAKDIDNPPDTYPVYVKSSLPKPSLATASCPNQPIPPADLAAAREAWRQQNLASHMVADFTADASGELFLYVNDAIQLMPFLGPFTCYYDNNSGSADITVQRMPLPQAK